MNCNNVFLRTLVVMLTAGIPQGNAHSMSYGSTARKAALACATVAGGAWLVLQFSRSPAFGLLKNWLNWLKSKGSTQSNYQMKLVTIDGVWSADADLPVIPDTLYNKNVIADTLQSEAAFTTGTNSKPVLATDGCGPCVALAGWEPQNRAGFLVHFANTGEVDYFKKDFSYRFKRLLTQEHGVIQLHLRGGYKGASEDIIDKITNWAQETDLLFPMSITSSTLNSSGFESKSMALDTRDGRIYSYDPKNNPHARKIGQNVVLSTLLSAYDPQINVVYTGIPQGKE